MTRVKSQIQHDYKSLVNPPHKRDGTRGRRWFFLGLVLPVLIVAGVLIMSPGNASSISDAPARTETLDTPEASPRAADPVYDDANASATNDPLAGAHGSAPDVTADDATSSPGLSRRELSLPPNPQSTTNASATAPIARADEAESSAGTTSAREPSGDNPQSTAAQDAPVRLAATDPFPTGDAPRNDDADIASAAKSTVRKPPTTSVKPVQKKSASPERASTSSAMRSLPLPPRRVDTAPVLVKTEHQAGEPLTLKIKNGDSLDKLFGRHALSRGDLATLLTLPDAKEALTLLMPGDEILVRHDGASVLGLTRALDEVRTLHVTRNDDGFATRIETRPVEVRIQRASATIRSSLFLAAKEAGISDTLAMNLAGIFAWDIDFVLDIRKGDSFSVIYEEIWQDGRRLRDGNILAARFVNDGEAFEAVRYTDPDDNPGYFTADGVNVKKAFLRAPIKFTPRVTSNFNPRRMHPVHKRVRPHRGVDYGAPTGTPILAAGDGKVIFRGRKGGYGNTVILQHGGNITTLYAHMSKFNRKVRSGSRVRQGQVIGYVGATGTVTARHLHYEYRVNGVHRNPRTVALPKARPIPKKFAADFRDATRALLSQLDVVSRSQDKRLAMAAAD